MKSGSRLLLIRTGPLFEEDPVESIIDLANNGHKEVAFAKFGKPLGKAFLDRLFLYGPDVYLAIYRSKRDKDQVTVWPIKRISTDGPAGAAFPNYYLSKKSFISTWVVVDASKPPKLVSLDNLTVTSSQNRARHALNTSMASHYLCSLN